MDKCIDLLKIDGVVLSIVLVHVFVDWLLKLPLNDGDEGVTGENLPLRFQ